MCVRCHDISVGITTGEKLACLLALGVHYDTNIAIITTSVSVFERHYQFVGHSAHRTYCGVHIRLYPVLKNVVSNFLQ